MKIPRLTKRQTWLTSVLFDIGKVAEWLAAMVICVLLLYVLSIGPACKLNQRGALPAVVKRAYRPLIPVQERCEFFDRFLMRYQCWWLGVPYTQLYRTNAP